jgi:hypothetical protein
VGTGRETATEFCLSVFLSYPKDYLTCRKILRHGTDGFNSPPKEVVLRIFIALKNPSLSVGFEPANLESNGKLDNHYTLRTTSVKLTVSITYCSYANHQDVWK